MGYADGGSSYEYVRSSVLVFVDASGRYAKLALVPDRGDAHGDCVFFACQRNLMIRNDAIPVPRTSIIALIHQRFLGATCCDGTSGDAPGLDVFEKWADMPPIRPLQVTLMPFPHTFGDEYSLAKTKSATDRRWTSAIRLVQPFLQDDWAAQPHVLGDLTEWPILLPCERTLHDWQLNRVSSETPPNGWHQPKGHSENEHDSTYSFDGCCEGCPERPSTVSYTCRPTLR
jgi:hypothetical protein